MGSAGSSMQESDTCSNCDLKFSRLARRHRRVCLECQACMCVSCLRNTNSDATSGGGKFPKITKRLTTGYCISCTIMLAGDSSDQLARLKVKHLKGFLVRRSVTEVNNCKEKRDLVDLILCYVNSPSHRERLQLEAGRTAELLARQADLLTERIVVDSETPSHMSDEIDPASASDLNLEPPTRMDLSGPSEVDSAIDPSPFSGAHSSPAMNTLSSSNVDQLLSSRIDTPSSSTQGSSPPFVDSSHTQQEIPLPPSSEHDETMSGCNREANQRVHPAEDASSGPSVEDSPTVNVTHSGNSGSNFSTTDSDTKQSSDSLSKISLSEIESVSEVDNLSVKQLKILLTRNLVTYKGCKEKHELISKVKMLWQARQDNEKLYQKLLNPQVSEDGTLASREEPELCKICMDSAIDCVLLDCGHMVSCTKCGKQMNECPICRQYVIRAVHIFRA